MIDNCTSNACVSNLSECVHHCGDVAVEDEIKRKRVLGAVSARILIRIEKKLWLDVERVRELLEAGGANAVDAFLVFLDLLEGQSDPFRQGLLA
jgi:hypothetical protein